jgi:hypothetical protein
MSRDRVHLDLQIALLYPASRSCSATRRNMQLRQSPAAARLAQEQTARVFSMASSATARILLSAVLVLARACTAIKLKLYCL